MIHGYQTHSHKRKYGKNHYPIYVDFLVKRHHEKGLTPAEDATGFLYSPFTIQKFTRGNPDPHRINRERLLPNERNLLCSVLVNPVHVSSGDRNRVVFNIV